MDNQLKEKPIKKNKKQARETSGHKAYNERKPYLKGH